MNELVDNVKKVAKTMAQTLLASNEQRSGIDHVNQAISQMEQVTQQTAALVGEAAASPDLLQEPASGLTQMVRALELGGGITIDQVSRG